MFGGPVANSNGRKCGSIDPRSKARTDSPSCCTPMALPSGVAFKFCTSKCFSEHPVRRGLVGNSLVRCKIAVGDTGTTC